MNKKVVEEELPVKEVNKMVRKSSILVLNAITASIKKRRSAWHSKGIEKKEKGLSIDVICKKYFGDVEFSMVQFQPWLFSADAHLFLQKHAKTYLGGVKTIHWNQDNHTQEQRLFISGKNQCTIFKMYGNDYVVELFSVYEWNGCLVFMGWSKNGINPSDFFVAPSGVINTKLNEFNDLYIKNSIIKGKYCEVWCDQNGLYFNILKIEPRDALFDNEDEGKLRKVEKVIECWDKLSKDERKMGLLLSGPPGTGKTAALSQLINRLDGRATVLNLKGGIAASLLNIYDWLEDIGPNVVIAEDFDTLSTENRNGNGFLSLLLNVLDGARQFGVITIATTNYPEVLDKALIRPGRLGVGIHLDEPSKGLKLRIIDHYCRKFGVDVGLVRDTLLMSGVLGCHIFSIIHSVAVGMKLGTSPQAALVEAADGFFGSDNVAWSSTRKKLGF